MMLLDTTTLTEYLAEGTAALKAQAVVDALADPVDVKVYDGSGNVKGSGVMATPWATQAAGVITVAEVTSFGVSVSGTLDATWYLRFESGTRWLRGGFGLAGSGQECIWSLPTWTAGQTGTIGTGIIGVPSNAAPSLVGAPSELSFTQYVGGTYDFGQHGTDPDGDTPLTYSLIGTAYTGITIPGGVLTVTAEASAALRKLTIRITDPGGLYSDHECAVTVVGVAAPRVVYYNGSFSSAGVPSRSSLADGGYFACKYEPEGAVTSYYTSPSNASGATASNLDGRVLQSERWPPVTGEPIAPRSGTHFMRQVIYYTKDYKTINDSTAPVADDDKPRVKYDQYNAVYGFDWDTEVWFGFSIRLSDTYIPDVATKNHNGGTMVWVLNTGTASGTQINLNRFCPIGDTAEKWMIRYQINDDAVADMDGDEGPKTIYVDLGSTTPDIGEWTDFVIRLRVNPFATTTNPGVAGITNAKNQSYSGNKGILQVWKGTGSADVNGNRTMSRVYSRVDQPVGGVPHATLKLYPSHRMYKYGWKKKATTSKQPIYQAFDEIRWGFGNATYAAGKGQSRASVSSDVSPSGEVLT